MSCFGALTIAWGCCVVADTVEAQAADRGSTQVLYLEIQLSPVMVPGPLERCICFDLYTADCDSDPTHLCEVLTFGGPLDFPGHALVELEIEAGVYVCIEAWDPLHTLRSKASMDWDGAAWTAVFKGDPSVGGNWLLSGNLDGNNVIDTVDYELFVAEFGADYGTGDTTCETEPPHADINGDGRADDTDFPFIAINLGVMSSRCCPDQADPDGDGDVDLNDLELFIDCFAGPGNPPDPTPPTSPDLCLDVFDLDADDDVDLYDFAKFAGLFTG